MDSKRWQKIKEILEKSLRHTPQTRLEYVENLCGADAELFSEVKSFLDYDEVEVGFLDAELILPEDLARNDGFIGKEIGKYKITREIGAGGMGVVFLAERTDGEFAQTVAVKFLRQSFFSKSSRRRFLRERQILAGLHHRYIAQMFDGGATEDGTPYLVMEYVEGEPITKFAGRRNLSLEERLDLFRKVCEAVSFAHRNLIVHRDLKPDNILINEDGEPKLLDFGIAKLLSATDEKVTATQHQALTPEYASPEQIEGAAITTASDIYSLGIILYEFLTGEHPFRRREMTASQIREAVHKSEPPRPSSVSSESRVRSPKSKVLISGFKFQIPGFRRRNGETSGSEIPNPKSQIRNPKSLRGDLDNIVLKALRREPERRYLSVREFSEDIKNYLRGFPVSARSDTFFYRADRFVRRNPLATAAVLIAFISLFGGLLAASYQARVANFERERAERRFEDVRRLANSFMFEINEEIEKSPARARELLVQRAVEYLDKLAQEAEGDAGLQSELATSYEKIGNVQAEIFKPTLGKTSAALESHRKSLEIRERLFQAEPNNARRGLDVVKSRLHIGDILSMSGELGEALENYRAALNLNEKLNVLAPSDYDIRFSLYRVNARVGQAVLRSGSLTESLENYERSKAILQELLKENPEKNELRRGEGIIHSYIGYAKMEMGEAAEAERDFKKSLEIMRNLLNENGENLQTRGNLATALLWHGVSFINLNKPDEAVAEISKALEIQTAIFEADRSNFGERNALADCRLELGRAFALGGQFDAAIENYQKAVENYDAILRADPENLSTRRQIALARRHKADAYRQKGATARALEIYRETLAEFEQLTKEDPHNIEWQHDQAICHLRIGEVLLQQNNQNLARPHLLTALPILEELASQAPRNVRIESDLKAVKTHLTRA